jgi:hypothetical protein
MDSARYFNPVLESFADAILSFDGNRIQVGQVSISESSPYKFDNQSLYIYNSGEWQYFGYGSTRRVAIRQNYAAYRIDGGAIQRFRGASQESYTVEEAVANTPFRSLLGMKSEKDTLIICTKEAYFE